MCCSAWKVNFSSTITGTWEVLIDGKINHVIWYQNRVGSGQQGGHITEMVFETLVRQGLGARIPESWNSYDDSSTNMPTNNLSAEQIDGIMKMNGISESQLKAEIAHRKSGQAPRQLKDVPAVPEPGDGNCLIIPLLGFWESIRLLNTADVPNLLLDVQESLTPVMRSMPMGAGMSFGGAGAIIFLKFDIYDIVLAERLTTAAKVLDQIQPDKRPKINVDVFQALERWYMCPFAICCFRDSERGESKPLAFAFEPTFPDKLVVYTLDGHEGNVPDLKTNVYLDHTIFVGSYLDKSGDSSVVRYQDSIPDHLRPYVLDRVMGTRLHDRMINGDILFSTEEVRNGRFEGLRSQPPFAPPGTAALGWKVHRQHF